MESLTIVDAFKQDLAFCKWVLLCSCCSTHAAAMNEIEIWTIPHQYVGW